MIAHGDFQLPGRVQVRDGWRRVWWKPWSHRPVYRTVFLGYIESVQADSNGIRLELLDAMSRLKRTRIA